MRPITMARQECANFEADGTCLGIDIKGDGKLVRFRPEEERCDVASHRCVYFEEAVQPMADTSSDPATARQYAEARIIYLKTAAKAEGLGKMKNIDGLAFGQNKMCIECGNAVAKPRSKRCVACSATRLKQQQKEARRRQISGRRV